MDDGTAYPYNGGANINLGTYTARKCDTDNTPGMGDNNVILINWFIGTIHCVQIQTTDGKHLMTGCLSGSTL